MVSEVCNIGPREQRKRRLLGIVALTIGVAAAFLLVVYDAPRLLRAVVFFPIWMAGLGLLQAREKTWIALAARGACNLDAGEESLEDESLVAQLRGKARLINRRALVTAIAITLLTLAFPRVWIRLRDEARRMRRPLVSPNSESNFHTPVCTPTLSTLIWLLSLYQCYFHSPSHGTRQSRRVNEAGARASKTAFHGI